MVSPRWLQFLQPKSGAPIPSSLRLAMAAVSGAALSFSFTGFYLAIYSWICIGVLIIALFGARPRVAFGCGFVHAVFFVLTSVPWIATVLSVHGGLSRAGGWSVLLLIAAAWGALVGSFAWCVNRLSRRSIDLACLGAPFLWVTFEFIRAHLPEISFPWNLLGYPAARNLGLVQITTWTGIYGLSFLVAAFNALLAWADAAVAPKPRKRLLLLSAATVAILAAILAAPRFVPQVEGYHAARAVQTDFPEAQNYESNWFDAHKSDLEELGRLSLQPDPQNPDLLIWPEAPAPFSMHDPHFARLASSLAIAFHHPFLAGAIEWKPPLETAANGKPQPALVPYNSAVLVDPQGQRAFSYDKIHLVPFGEYEPFPLIHRVVASVSDEVGGFRKGPPAYATGKLPEGYTFGAFICYEAIYPGEVRRFVAHGAGLLINISNDGWFGRSAAPEQHLRMAAVRAVENRRWLLRVTNNGYTASVDPYGRVTVVLPADVRAAADLAYDFRTDVTLYARYGDWFAWLCVIVSVILIARTFWKGNLLRDEIAIPVGKAVSPAATPAAT